MIAPRTPWGGGQGATLSIDQRRAARVPHFHAAGTAVQRGMGNWFAISLGFGAIGGVSGLSEWSHPNHRHQTSHFAPSTVAPHQRSSGSVHNATNTHGHPPGNYHPMNSHNQMDGLDGARLSLQPVPPSAPPSTTVPSFPVNAAGQTYGLDENVGWR